LGSKDRLRNSSLKYGLAQGATATGAAVSDTLQVSLGRVRLWLVCDARLLYQGPVGRKVVIVPNCYPPGDAPL